jgi:hypothetical protein
MTTPEAITAASKGGTLHIRGYRSAAGAESNYTVKFLGPNGYRDLVRESLALLRAGKVTNPGFSHEDWGQAVAEKDASWEKTLGGETAPKNYAKPLAEHEGYETYLDAPDTYILRNLMKVSEEIVTAGEEKFVKSAAKTLAKAAIDKMLPISKYLGQLNLVPGKYTSVTYHP